MAPIPLSFKKLFTQEPAIQEIQAEHPQPLINDPGEISPDEYLQQQQQQLMQMAPAQRQLNPFAGEQYRNVNMPDAPVSFGGGIAESLLNNEEVPEKVRKEYWNVFHKDNVLTFLDEERKASKLLNWDIQKIDILNTVPYYQYTFEKELELDILRNVYETKLDRALGFKGSSTKNERIVLQSQFTEARQISEDGSSGSIIKEGFFKRLLRRKG